MILIYLGCSAIASFALAIALGLAGTPPAAVAHAAFAIGALPLIFAAVLLVILAEAMSKRAPVAEAERVMEDDAELDEFAQEEIEV